MPGCRPVSRCLCSAAPDPSACSRSAGSGRLSRPQTPAARAGGGTRRWPSLLPGGHCTAARGGGWSCSTPAAGWEKTRNRSLNILLCHRLFRLVSGLFHSAKNSLTLLSLPPDARCWWSGDHLRPHTSCLWPCSLLSAEGGVLTSRCRITLSRLPDDSCSPFHARAPKARRVSYFTVAIWYIWWGWW